MSSSPVQQLRTWLKHSPNPMARRLFRIAKAVRTFEVPAPRLLVRPLYAVYRTSSDALEALVRILWWTPLFKGRVAACGRRLYLFGGLPLVTGPLTVTVGSDCRISGATTFSGRSSPLHSPRLEIGDNVGIGWQTTIAVASRVKLGNNVRIAGRTFLAGYPGHPLDAADRAAGLPDTEDQVGEIVLEDDVWLGTGVSVMSGVTIGRGTVVAAGSMVTRSLPPGVVAAGMPAKVVRELPPAREPDADAA